MRKDAIIFNATGRIRLAPDKLFHRLVRLHPRSAGFAPPRRAGDSSLHPVALCLADAGFEYALPLVGHVGDPVVDDLGSGQSGIEDMETSDSDAVHPFDVCHCAFHGHVAVHPVPPDPGPGIVRRRKKAFLQSAGGRSRGLSHG